MASDRLGRLEHVRLYLVVTPAAHGAGWERALESALETGVVGMVQVRDKVLDDRTFVQLASKVRRLADERHALLILNDRVHLVHDVGADGAHVGETDVPAERAREFLGDGLLLGVSTHDAEEVASAARRGADHAGLGPCFPTRSKALDRRPRGADLVRRALPHASGLPVFPIGGITPENAPSVRAAGATRLAVGAGVIEAENPAAAALRLTTILRASNSPQGGISC